jgi:monoamine oxidase
MPHLAITKLLKKAFNKALKDIELNPLPTDEFNKSRRNFLKQTTLAGAGMVLLPSFLNAHDFDQKKKIVVVGAGMAGLNAAYQLKKLGLNVNVYEAANSTGGRMFTMKNLFGNNITTDIGGEFVDTTHEAIISLMQEFKLEFYDLRTDQLSDKTFFFGGENYSEEQLSEALKPFVLQIERDIHSLPEIKNYTTATAIEKLDQQSIASYLTNLGVSGWLYDFLNVVLTREFGMEATEQSAINFLIMFDEPKTADTHYQLFGKEHEVFKIKGGSQHLTDKLTEAIKSNIHLQHQLVSITENKENISLDFISNGKKIAITADYVIMTLPFSILRKIPFHSAMPEQKRRAINELGYGNSCKFIMGFNEKAWHRAGKQGYTFTDESFGCGWDSSQLQSDKEGSFTVFGGGLNGEEINKNKQGELSRKYVAALDKIYPGSAKAYSGKNMKFCWANAPVARAGYSCYKIGQYSTLAGWEALPVGNVYFAGEHTSVEFQGYMNGAAETGKTAALNIAAKILNNKKN